MAVADYVIIGGGAAGCVLAYRLSADPAVHVTLIEAGAGLARAGRDVIVLEALEASGIRSSPCPRASPR